MTREIDAQHRLVAALRDPARYPHATGRISVIETHISFVILTGGFAYKLKKAVDLGFLDFTTLEKRRFYCEEELRLNRRLAPDLYLDLVPIGGPADDPHPGAAAQPIEYAVRMVEFPQSALLDGVLARGELLPRHLDALADTVADFHDRIARAGAADSYGTPEAIRAPMEQNFSQIRGRLSPGEDHAALAAIETWSRAEHARLREFLGARRRDGFVRECHGDLHLGNVALVEGVPRIFDCIEFNPGLRWIDVVNEIAFMVMDLADRGREDYAHRFLNRYLEACGDYAGLRALPFYLVYRAMVRAKVARIRAAQADAAPGERDKALAAGAGYLEYARRVIAPRPRGLLLMHGFSGSGKTHVAQALLESIGAVRLRSDVERKRLYRLAPLARSDSAPAAGLYDAASTEATYRRLAQLAQRVLEAGFPVVVDAACLKQWQREMFRRLAREADAPFLILDCRAADSVLRRRVAAREASAADASEAGLAVLDHQLRSAEPLAPDEQASAISIDTETADLAGLAERVRRRLA